MGTVIADLEALSVNEPIFKDVKYYLTGDVPEKIVELLNAGGAERTQYFSDFVTHLICGANPSETDLADASDLYEIPATTAHWVVACIKLKKLVSSKPYSPNRSQIFSNVVACISKVSSKDFKSLYALITFCGGTVKTNFDTKCTHLISSSTSGSKYSAALNLTSDRVKIVTPDWVTDSIQAKIQCVAEVYHPKLVVTPAPAAPMPIVKQSESRISAITGFDFEEGIAKNEVPTQNLTDKEMESTQALLDKLKQRMPWNHPPTSTSVQTGTVPPTPTPPTTPTANLPSTANKNKVSTPQAIMTQSALKSLMTTVNTPSMQQQPQYTQQPQPSSTLHQNVAQNQNIQQVSQQNVQQVSQQTLTTQAHGLSAIHMQQQRLLQQHQFKMQMLHQQNQNKNQSQGLVTSQGQTFGQAQQQNPNTSLAHLNQNAAMSQQNQTVQHLQNPSGHIMQQNQSLGQFQQQSQAQQQIQNITQLLNQQTSQINQQGPNVKLTSQHSQISGLSGQVQNSLANQTVQSIAQQIAQSTQALAQQSAQGQGLTPKQLNQTQMLSQQQIISNTLQNLNNQQQNQQGNMNQPQSNQNIPLNQQQNQQTLSTQQNVTPQTSIQNTMQLNQIIGGNTQSQMSQQNMAMGQQQGQQGVNVPLQTNWRQQNIQMVQNVSPNQNQQIRSPMMHQRNQQSQILLQQQMIQNQQAQAILAGQQQLQQSPQHNVQQNSQQLLQQAIGLQQAQGTSSAHHQILVQKQQMMTSGQHIVQGQQQVLINQHVGQPTHQQILVQGNQHITLQGGQQLVSQSQIMQQGNQQIITQGGQQILTQAGQHIITQGPQHQVVISQAGQLVSQSGQQIVAQATQQNQVLTNSQQSVQQLGQGTQPGSQTHQVIAQPASSVQQIITHQGNQQVITQNQQIMQGQQPGQNVGWQQQQQQQYLQQRQQQIIAGPPGAVGPRLWASGTGGRQLIHLDAQTHAQLQQMDPKQRALFVAQLQKRSKLQNMQRAAALAQQQQHQQPTMGQGAAANTGGTAQSITFIRGQIPPGLTQQQQVQWLQQQGARATSVTPAPTAPTPQPTGAGGSVGGAVAGVVGAGVGSGGSLDAQLQHLQLQRQQQYQRLQQLQAQREHAVAQHHQHTVGAPGAGSVRGVTPGAVLAEGRTDGVLVAPSPTTDPGIQMAGLAEGGGPGALVVNPKTKTALANMLSIRRGVGGTGVVVTPGAVHAESQEPSAAGTLRLMTAAHNAPPRTPAAGSAEALRGATSGATRLLLGNAGVPPPALLVPPPHPTHPHHATNHQVGAKMSFAVGASGAMSGGGVGGAGGASPARPPPPPRAQFYGHNPNLPKLPPDLFLLGCVFHIVEYQQSWGSERVARWSEAVGRRGGEVEAAYCARVTHVLCETQRHGVVMQALRDAKRCVTAYWLSDTMMRRSVSPPWQALHLPPMYGARDRPARRHRVAVSGWRNDERHRVRFMIEHVGATLTPYMSRENTVLICRRPEGAKYKRAREWGIPCVSALWLTDLLLGNMSALSQIENQKYQQFNIASPFRMDYTLVPHLMNAWKMPINITQESHERVKRGALPVAAPRRAKRPRLHSNDEDDDTNSLPAPLPTPPGYIAPRVLFSSVRDANKLGLIVRHLGGMVVTSACDATHLVMERLVRTTKLVSCLVVVKHLLTPAWLRDSRALGAFADEAKYALRDPEFDQTFGCDVSDVLLSGEQRRKLFDGVTFYLTPCVNPSRTVLTEMIELCGGKVDKNRKSLVSIQEMHKEKAFSYLVLTSAPDLHLVYYLLQAERGPRVVCNTEVVMSAVLRQKLEIEPYLVKID